MSDIPQAVANLEAWLETMRCPGANDHRDGSIRRAGYGGPVVHWWANCLSYTGPGLDWRYEGIIIGYMTLWQRTGQQQWLEKACRAGDDLVNGQLPSGNFRNSCFELNPYTGGTPHEAAADLGLLRLALCLRDIGDESWSCYAETAERNLQEYFINRLWDKDTQSFRDHPDTPSFVPNKACTLAEALFAWAELRGDEEPIERIALPTMRAVLSLQIREPGRLHGAIAQNTLREEVVEAYFPYYIARCIPALVLAHDHTGDHRWLESAGAALSFIARQVDDDGLLPQVLYRRGQNRYPQWIATLGDVLRAAHLLAGDGVSFPAEPVLDALLRGAQPGGGIDTARGFGVQANQKHDNDSLPAFRDNIPVTGWNDKAFRFLVALIPRDQPLPEAAISTSDITCQLRGIQADWKQTDEEMRLRRVDGEMLYLWSKRCPWAEIVAHEVNWK